jgi:hypothetical protein
MKLESERESENVQDRRGGLGRAGGWGIGSIIVALILSYLFGIDPSVLLGVADNVRGVQQSGAPIDPSVDPQAHLVSEMKKILAKTEDTWGVLFQEMGGRYAKPQLVLYSGSTQTSCGQGQAAMGPFYCPQDQSVYLDLRFFDQMERRFKAGGDFARAYVIAHEIGHHVQNQVGITRKTQAMRSRMSEREYNKVSVRVELQADCFAGVWAYHANNEKPFIEPGDIEEAIRAASAVGDDALQRASRGTVVPDSFTHGTSMQRVSWFKRGFDTGSVKACDTFSSNL